MAVIELRPVLSIRSTDVLDRWGRAGLVALALAAGAAGALSGHGEVVALVFAGYLLAVGAWLAIVDARTHRLPNRLIVPSYFVLAALLALYALTTGDWGAVGRAVVVAAITGAVYFGLAYWGSMGMGDVKLGILLGGALGWASWTAALTGPLFGFVLAAVAAVVLMIAGRGRGTHIAFGPYLIAGAIAVLAITRLA
ncbi:prepilin peptidase [Agromyces bauzanensis]